MATSVSDIERWLNRANPDDTHMLVVCDTFDYEDYPVFVSAGENVEDVISKHSGNMQRVMEVYDLRKDIQQQLNAGLVWNI